MIHFKCERARTVDFVEIVQKDEVIEITRTSEDYESIHILDTVQASNFFAFLGKSSDSNIATLQEIVDAGQCEEIIQAFEKFGNIAYSRVEAEWGQS